MKKIIVSGVIAFASALLAPQKIQAQGAMTYVSNLGQSSTGSLAVGSDSWLAEDFNTGTNAGGYTLDSIQLGMADALGNPNAFTVMLYTATEKTGIFPGSSLGTLDGSLNPTSAGIYTYTPASSLTLLPETQYFIVLTAGTTVANGAYEWLYANTSSYNPNGGWNGGVAFISSNGSSPWHAQVGNPQSDFPEVATDAIPVPEPGVLTRISHISFTSQCY
jgi:hypothetical protein